MSNGLEMILTKQLTLQTNHLIMNLYEIQLWVLRMAKPD